MKVKELAQSAIGDSADVDTLLACKWVSDRFIELAVLIRAVPYRRQKQFVFPKNVIAGLATFTEGSNKVTGDATALAAWGPTLVGRFIRADGDNGWYQVINTSGTDLTLSVNYAGDTATLQGYKIAPRVITFDKTVRTIHSFTNNKFGKQLTRMNHSEMDLRFPNRIDVAGGPLLYSEVGLDENDNHLIEFYPYTSEDTLITYMAFVDPKPLTPEQEIPAFIPAHILIEGVKLNIYESLMGQSFQEQESGSALTSKLATLGNIAARQKTIWKAAKTDFENVSGIHEESKTTVQSYGRSIRDSKDVVNAHEHVLVGWSPLT